jgi:hypothetical protein
MENLLLATAVATSFPLALGAARFSLLILFRAMEVSGGRK